ncbi:MarR family winged helix-turn-helix transcriptional regulator [Sinomonas susongensis]|uniref:MarR family winged helix-turn-helix transcriptional regulator n=1 Tax=Sinomonas susongensis TaxID=1324851 RepID=UPI0014868D92|nr:MarR family winged helix-turn-helix transcriptional regulator [Sinomonas susongensis]
MDATRGLRHLIHIGEDFRRTSAKRLGIASSDFVALGHVYWEGPALPRELGALLDMGSGTVTAVLDRLEKRGYITRTAHPTDRRSLLIVITRKGREAMDVVYGEFDVALRQALEGVGGEEDAAALGNMLERLSDAAAEAIAANLAPRSEGPGQAAQERR